MMTTRTSVRLSAALGATIIAFTALASLTSAASQKFYDDDPIWVERDTEDASGMKMLEIDLAVDLASNLLADTRGAKGPAKNVNTVGEVPDSSWFTNRAGRRALTAQDVETGPSTSAPAAGTWTIIASKSDGVTPGFTIRDAGGQVWFLKFDPPGFRGMSTGTEVAVTKLMWALGYNVPENRIAYLRREALVVGEGAKFTPPGGGARRAMRHADIDVLLAGAGREADGSYRIVASKALAGKPIGRIRFNGTRPDDPNDIVPHEDRRELRGYGVFAAWLNHVDAKAINSLDMLVAEEGRSFVRHHLIDFGSSLGSGGVAPADHWAGHQYLLQPRDIAKQMLGFGFRAPGWHTAKSYEAPSVGRLPQDNASFNPELWKPRVPNRAFLRARADDTFWAAQKLVALTDEMLEAAVRTGEFNDPVSEGVLVRVLSERRDAIARTYLNAINPVADPALGADGILMFRNAAVDAGVAAPPSGYRAVWSTFDNTTGTSRTIASSAGATARLEAPAGLPSAAGAFVKVEVSSTGGSHPSWEVPVEAYFRLVNGGWQLVGFTRIP